MPRPRKRQRTDTSLDQESLPQATDRMASAPQIDPSQPALDHQVLRAQDSPVLEEMLEEMRSIISCKICFRLLYEPYTISCGHTYCYSCLSQWFKNNAEGRRKTCPGCRAAVGRAPAPSFTLREITQKFISHPELLSDGETKDQHQQWSAQEAEAVDKDRVIAETMGGGVFPGVFPRENQHPRLRPVIDDDDGVERCPYCNWEIEEEDDPVCPRCGERHALDGDDESFYGEEGDIGFSDLESEDIDEDDIDGEDLNSVRYGHPGGYGDEDDYDSETSEEEVHGPITQSYAHLAPVPGGNQRPRLHHAGGGSASPNVHHRTRSIGTHPLRDSYASDDDDSSEESSSVSQQPLDNVEEDDSESDDGSSLMDGFIDDDQEHDGYDDNDLSNNTDGSFESESDITVRDSTYRVHDNVQRPISVESSSSSDTSNEDADDDEHDDDDEGVVSRPARRRFNR